MGIHWRIIGLSKAKLNTKRQIVSVTSGEWGVNSIKITLGRQFDRLAPIERPREVLNETVGY